MNLEIAQWTCIEDAGLLQALQTRYTVAGKNWRQNTNGLSGKSVE
jgi:hypothetical protein